MKIRSFFAALAVLGCALDAEAGAVVVAADSSAGAMDAEAVKAVFLGKNSQVGGAKAVVVFQKTGATRDQFDGAVLGKPGAQLSTYWSKLVFTGKAAAPDEVDGDAGVKAKVAATPGAIGYVSDAAVDGSVKVLYQF